MALDLECKILEEELKEFWPEWHVVRYIGGGAFGKVFYIYKDELGVRSDSALKILRIDGSSVVGPDSSVSNTTGSSENLSRSNVRGERDLLSVFPSFTNEIRIMETLRGAPNIVAIQDFYYRYYKERNSGHLYVRMELLTSFRDLLNKRNHTAGKKSTDINNTGSGMLLSVPQLCKFAMDICRALIYCEDNHIIHRDIKPENLFIDRFGNYKIGDFGVSRSMATVHMADSMTSVGTISYMAPEIYRHKAYNNTVDIYSLGLVLYQLLNQGRMPFLPKAPSTYNTSDVNSANYKRLTGEEIPPLKGVDPVLDQIIRKACAYRSEERYQSARTFYNAIGRYAMQQSQKQRQMKTPSQNLSQTEQQPCQNSIRQSSLPAAVTQSPSVQKSTIGATSPAASAVSSFPSTAATSGTSVTEKPSSAITSSETADSSETAPKKKSIPSFMIVLASAAVVGITVIALALSGSFSKVKNLPSNPDDTAAIAQENQDSDEPTVDEGAEVDEEVYDDTNDGSIESIPAGNNKVIVFSDSGLEQAVRDSLGIEDKAITIADAEKVTSLDCSRSDEGIWYDIRDITELSCFTQLKDLDLGNNFVDDLTPLENLVYLERLDLYGNPVENLSPLAGLTQLKNLNLNESSVENISPLSSLEQLEYLNLDMTSVEDLSALAGMKHLKEIQLSYTLVKDASVLGTLKELKSINLENSEIKDISFLNNLKEVEILNLNDTLVQDISALSGLEKIRELYLNSINWSFESNSPRENMIDLSPIRGLVSLEKLSLESDALSDVSILSDLKNLKELNLAYIYFFEEQMDLLKQSLAGMENLKVLDVTCIDLVDCSLVEGLTQLERLYIGGNYIEDLSPLTSLTNLKALYVVDNFYTDISCLSGLTELTELEVGRYNYSTISNDLYGAVCEGSEEKIDLSPIYSMTQLKVLNVVSVPVEDLSFLEQMPQLEKLYLGGCGITDLSSLSSLKNLKALNLNHNQITDLSPLSNLTNLRVLTLYSNKLENISGIENLRKLTELSLDENPIKDYLPLKSFSEKVITDIF